MSGLLQKFELPISLGLLFFGWMGPQYASKLWGDQLGSFIGEQPIAAGIISTLPWFVVLFVPRLEGFPQKLAAPSIDDEVGPVHTCCIRRLEFMLPMILVLCCSTVFVIGFHAMWYASIYRTSAFTNSVLYNTDTTTTAVFAVAFSLQPFSWWIGLGVMMTMGGTYLSAHEDSAGQQDTFAGCMLCLMAATCYSLYVVLIEKYLDRKSTPIIRLLGYQGLCTLVIVAALLMAAGAATPTTVVSFWNGLPGVLWLLYLGAASLCLNLGWLWCVDIAGAFWTAMSACLAVPITMFLDVLLFDHLPTLANVSGAGLICMGFLVVSRTTNSAQPALRLDVTEEPLPISFCSPRSWLQWWTMPSSSSLPFRGALYTKPLLAGCSDLLAEEAA